ncbi:MAG: hypothetical protein QXX77_10275, partial [Candidatus Methanosuratincola sp.]
MESVLSSIPQAEARGEGAGVGGIRVYITTLQPIEEESLKALWEEGAVVEIYDRDLGIAQARVSPGILGRISALPFVKFIDLPTEAHNNAGSVTTEGDTAIEAFEARAQFGVSGLGVRVGVISDGIAGLTESIASGDLPPSIMVPSVPLVGIGTSLDDPCPPF